MEPDVRRGYGVRGAVEKAFIAGVLLAVDLTFLAALYHMIR
jgi:hypothetical protein